MQKFGWLSCLVALLPFFGVAETYTLAGSDDQSASAMNGTGTFGWTDPSGTTTKNHKPSAGNDYVVDLPYILRTPTSTFAFGGDTLTLSGDSQIKVKVGNNTLTIPILIVAGAATIANGDASVLNKIAGAIDIQENGLLKFDVSVDNSAGSARMFEVQSVVSGIGTLWTGASDDIKTDGAYVKFTGSLADFTGKLAVQGRDTKQFATVFASLPGDPDALMDDGLTVEGNSALKFETSGKLGITRGISFNSGQGEIYVAEGKTVQIDGQLAGEAGFKKTGKGTLALANISPDLLGTVTVAAGTLQLCDAKEVALPEADVTVASGAVLDEHGPAVDHDPFVEATLTGFDVIADGQPHSPVLTVTEPAEGWQASWSTDGGDYVSERPTFTEPGEHTVICRVSAAGHIAQKLRTTVRIRRPAQFAYEFTATVNYRGTETLVDFPVLVRLPMPVTSRMRNDGRDVRFYLEDGTTELVHECESFDRVKGALYWVKIPALSPGMKLVIKFRDPEFDTEPDATAVWSSYIGVWHLDDVKTSCIDATGGTPNGAVGTSCNSVEGKIATACQMIWTSDWSADNTAKIDITNKNGSLATEGRVTVSWWMKPNAAGAMPRVAKDSVLFDARTKKGHSIWKASYEMSADAAPQFVVRSYKYNDWGNNSFSLADADEKLNLPGWTHTAVTLANEEDGLTSSGQVFRNAELLASGNGLYPVQSMDTDAKFYISNNNNYKGQMDEFRIRAVVSSLDWLAAERDSVDDPEFVKLPDDLDKRFVVTRRVVATEAEKTGAWADAVVAGNDAYVALQGVIDASANYDTILVKAGTYNLTKELSFASDVLTGVTFRSDDGAGNLARKTTLLVGGYPATMNRLVYIATPGVIVDGFTLSNGYVNEAPGGGAYLDNCGADAGLRNCDIVGCTAWNEQFLTSSVGFSNGTGGGAYIKTTGCISNCLFKSNVSFAGAVSLYGAQNDRLHPPKDTPWVTHCEFVWNEQIGKGTANSCNGSAVASRYACCVDHCLIVSNFCNVTDSVQISTVGSNGGYLTLSNCVFRSNGLGSRKVKLIGTNSSSTIRCVGNTFIDEVASPILSNVDGCNRNTMINCTGVLGATTVYNCLFVGNTNSSDSGCLSGACTVENCTFIGNKGAIYSNGGGTTASRTNRIVNCVFFDNEKDVYAINSGNATPIALFVSNCCIRAWSLDQRSGSNRQFGLVITNDCNLLYSDEDLAAVQRSIIKFRDPAAGDWRLKRKSLLRDAGMVRPWMNGAVDRDGLPRRLDRKGRASEDALPDIGAHECEIFPNGLVVTIQQIEEASSP